jgi:EmrB/QacA subfamily drug resistance transporter
MLITDNRTRNRVLLVLFLGVLMGALDIAIVGPALSSIKATFGVDDRLLAWTFAIYVLFNLIGTPLMAKLSDIFGRRSVYVADVTLFAIGSLVVALSPSFTILLAGRALQGFGAGGIFPVASAVIGDTFPAEKRGGALGLIGAVFGLAFIIGPILGGVLLMAGWQWLFLINLPVALLVIVMSLRLLPTTRAAERKPFDWPGMVVLSLLLISLTYGINQVDTSDFGASLTSLNVWPFLLLALLLLPVFRAIERRAADPILRMSLFGSRQAVLANLLSAGAGLGEAGLVFLPALAIAALGVAISTASFMLIPVVLALSVGAPTAGRYLDRYGSKVVVIVGTALLAVGMAVLGLGAASLVLFIVAGVLIGLGLAALLGAPVRYIMLNEAPPADRAAAQGAVTLFASVGQLVGGAAIGALIASQAGDVAGYSTAYLVISGVAVVLTLLALSLKDRAAEQATAQRQMAAVPAANSAPDPVNLVPSMD